MKHCVNCNRDLREGEEFDLVRLQVWKTKVGAISVKRQTSMKQEPTASPALKKR